MKLFPLKAKTTAPTTPPSLSIRQVPQSTFMVRAQMTPDAIIQAKNARDKGELLPIKRLYNLMLIEDLSCASAVDVRLEALKSAVCRIENTNLLNMQQEYFKLVIRRFYPVFCEMLIQLKLTGSLFRQIEYNFTDALYYPSAYTDYPLADLRLQDGSLQLYSKGKPDTFDYLHFISAVKDPGALYSTLKYYVFYSFALNNWAQFTETYGKPPRLARYAPGTSEVEKSELWRMLQNFGSDLAAMISENVKLEFADFSSKSASVDLYSRLVEFCDDRITRRILGQTLSTKSVGDGGSYAQAKVHNLVRQDILSGDLRDLDALISSHLTQLNYINFNADEINVSLSLPQAVDLSQRIVIDEKLYNTIGIEFPENYWYDTYGIPNPQA
jgi:hypothetical protein